MSPIAPLRDIVIAGAGIAGATLALSLKRAVGNAVAVVLCDPAFGRPDDARGAFRAVAVAADTRALLDRLGLWQGIEAGAHPIHTMVITDGRPGLLPNPTFLTFDEAGPDQPIAHMVFVEAVRQPLLAACAAAGVECRAVGITGFAHEPYSLMLTMSDGGTLRTRLLAAADGGRSRLRHVARIQTNDHAYPQSAVVATLAHTEEHRGRAIQHFLPAGPIALLPMRAADGTGRRTSIVWTERHAEAERLAALAPDAFVAALQERIGLGSGALHLEDRPVAYPLRLTLARRLTAPRLALLGDAARIIHPLAGQGLNLGLRDAAALARRVVDHAALGLDPGAPDVLAAYERDRRLDATTMAAATDLLDRLFSTDAAPVRMLRDLGLGLVDRAPRLKRRLAVGAGSVHVSDHDGRRAAAPIRPIG